MSRELERVNQAYSEGLRSGYNAGTNGIVVSRTLLINSLVARAQRTNGDKVEVDPKDTKKLIKPSEEQIAYTKAISEFTFFATAAAVKSFEDSSKKTLDEGNPQIAAFGRAINRKILLDEAVARLSEIDAEFRDTGLRYLGESKGFKRFTGKSALRLGIIKRPSKHVQEIHLSNDINHSHPNEMHMKAAELLVTEHKTEPDYGLEQVLNQQITHEWVGISMAMQGLSKLPGVDFNLGSNHE